MAVGRPTSVSRFVFVGALLGVLLPAIPPTSVASVAATVSPRTTTTATQTAPFLNSSPARASLSQPVPPVRWPVAMHGSRRSVTLQWTESSSSDARSVVIRRASGRRAPQAPTKGTAVTTLPRRRTTYTDRQLQPGTTYSYALFARGRHAVYSRRAVVHTATPLHAWRISRIDPRAGEGLVSVSCVPSGFCAAGDARGEVLTNDGTGWSRVQLTDSTYPEITITQVDCSAANFCLATWLAHEISRHGTYSTFPVEFASWNGVSWSVPHRVLGLSDVPLARMACAPGTQTCVAARLGDVFRYVDGIWSPAQPLGADVRDVSCAGAGDCVALTKDAFSEFSNGSWGPLTPVPGASDLTSVACPAAGECLAVGVTEAFRLHAGAWEPTQAGPGLAGAPVDVSCTPTAWCLVLDGSGVAAAYDGTSWTHPDSADGLGQITAVSCSSRVTCIATVRVPSTLYGTPPYGTIRAWDGSSWSPDQYIDPNQGLLTSLSCPTWTSCMAIDASENAIRLRGGRWRIAHGLDDHHGYGGWVSCAGADSCAAIFDNGYATTFDGTSWTDSTLVDDIGIFFRCGCPAYVRHRLSCPTSDFCVATSADEIWTYRSGIWSGPHVLAQQPGHHPPIITDVGCPNRRECFALLSPRQITRFNGHAWSAPSHVPGHGKLRALSCPTARYCLAVGQVDEARYADGQWTALPRTPRWRHTVDRLTWLDSVSCASQHFCMAIDHGGMTLSYDGTTWSAPTKVMPTNREDGYQLIDVACPTLQRCRVTSPQDVGTYGR
jgi:hypothetical protein